MISDRYKLSKISRILMKTGLAILFATVMYIGFLHDGTISTSDSVLYITLKCRLMIDYLLLSVVILIGGSLFVDCVKKEKI